MAVPLVTIKRPSDSWVSEALSFLRPPKRTMDEVSSHVRLDLPTARPPKRLFHLVFGSCAAFEKRWPLGTTPRTVYAIARYFGHRRSDVATAKWSDLEVAAGNVVQSKTGKALWIPMHPKLAKALGATPRRGEYVVITQYGRPFSAKALGMRMQDWTGQAGLASGHTLHGLRKKLGAMLAEAGATTRELMAILGHDDIAHAELYSCEAEQRRLASEGTRKLTKLGEPLAG